MWKQMGHRLPGPAGGAAETSGSQRSQAADGPQQASRVRPAATAGWLFSVPALLHYYAGMMLLCVGGMVVGRADGQHTTRSCLCQRGNGFVSDGYLSSVQATWANIAIIDMNPLSMQFHKTTKIPGIIVNRCGSLPNAYGARISQPHAGTACRHTGHRRRRPRQTAFVSVRNRSACSGLLRYRHNYHSRQRRWKVSSRMANNETRRKPIMKATRMATVHHMKERSKPCKKESVWANTTRKGQQVRGACMHAASKHQAAWRAASS